LRDEGTARRSAALVTGASSGIGLATAHRLLASGWAVYAAARRTDPMRPLAEAGATLLPLDVTDDEACAAAVARIHDEVPGLDALVNAAGYGHYGALEDVPLAEARQQMEVNVFAGARLTRLVLPRMRERRRGRIVFVSSFGGKIALPLGAWYHASKFAIEAIADSLRGEVAPFGIRVVVIQPGFTRSGFARINYDHLEKASADGPYADLARRTRRLGLSGYEEGGLAVEPDVVGRVVARAVTTRRPRTRYAVPLHSRGYLALRWLLPDRWFDAVVRAQLRVPWMVRRLGPFG